MCGFCSVWLCVIVCCVVCSCVNMWVVYFVGLCTCGVGRCGGVYVWRL